MTILAAAIIQAAQDAEKRWGPPACAGLAQCILESQGFKYEPAGSNNGLGIQALPGLPEVAAKSFEYINGKKEPVVEHFAKFESIEAAFFFWGKLLATNPVYKEAFAARANWRTFIQLMSMHYATAPNYGNILVGIVEANALDAYNVIPSAAAPAQVQGSKPMGLLATLTSLITNAPTEIAEGEALVGEAAAAGKAAISALESAAAAPAAASFITLVESFFHISPATAGAASVVEPKTLGAPATSRGR